MSCAIWLSSCQTAGISAKKDPPSDWEKFAKAGHKFLAKGKFELASRSFNDALKLDIQNANLQALNGIAYHLSARGKDSSNFSLAEQGYKLSTKFDPSNWMPHYLLGLVNVQQKRYETAKKNFIRAVIRNRGSEKLWLHLLAAAYYSLDFDLAGRTALYLRKRKGLKDSSLELNRSCALVFAALNDQFNLTKCLESYYSLKPAEKNQLELVQKIAVWEQLHRLTHDINKKVPGGRLFLAQTTDDTTETDTETETDTATETTTETDAATTDAAADDAAADTATEAADEAENLTDERMVVVDVVIIGTREDNRDQTGINLLNGLAFQFGDTTNSINAWSKSTTISRDLAMADSDSTVRAIVRAVTIPAISYSLNIVNSVDSQSKILAKPSLIALSGQNSVFFSGVTVAGAATSGTGDSVSIEKEVGVKLDVTPTFIDDDKVQLKVSAERTFVMDPSTSVKYQYRLDTTKTTVASTVILNIGDTLVLGGLTEQEDTDVKDGVPYVQDIPFVGLGFSKKEKRRYKKSITILLTPRAPDTKTKSPDTNLSDLDKNLRDPNEMLLEQLIGSRKRIETDKEADFIRYKRNVSGQYVSVHDLGVRETDAGIIQLAQQLTQY